MAVRPTDPEALQLFQLIGAPLLAVIQAEAQAAQVSADFIRRVGFDGRAAESDGTAPATPESASRPQGGALEPRGISSPSTALQDGGDLGSLRIAEFRLDRPGSDGRPQSFVARVPVLSLFPIPLLQVKHADFNFDIRVLSRVPLDDPREGKKDSQLSPQSSLDYLAKDRVELKGFLASSRGGSNADVVTDASIKVSVRMEQADLPVGLIRLMSIMGENVSLEPLALIEQGATRDSKAAATGANEAAPARKDQ